MRVVIVYRIHKRDGPQRPKGVHRYDRLIQPNSLVKILPLVAVCPRVFP